MESSTPEEDASEKKSKGRPRLPEDVRQLRMKESRKKYAKKQSSIKLKNTVKKKLITLKKQNKFKSWDQLMDFMLRSASCQTELSSSNDSDDDDSDDDDLLKSVVITRLVTEASVSVVKVPLVLALCSLFFKGRVYPEEIVSATQVTRMTNSIFKIDAGLLRQELSQLKSIHLQADMSIRKQEERASVWVTGNHPQLVHVLRAILWTGALASKSGSQQFDMVVSLLTNLNIFDRLRTLTADEGRDAIGTKDGLYG